MSDASDVRKPIVSPVRRVCAVLLSLILPGAGHCLLGAFRRGVVWLVALSVLRILLPYAGPLAATIWSALAVVIVGRVAAGIDAAWIVGPTPPWGRVAGAWAALLVISALVSFAVVRPLASYYAQHYAQALVIPTGGMEPTLLVGDSIIIDRSAYRDRAPQRHDIVAFSHPQDEQRDSVKRIVGMPGDVIVVRGAQVFINGQALREPYLSQISGSTRALPVICRHACEPTFVPAGSYFVLGDNRSDSEDSRFWGFLRRDSIKGKAHSIYWSWDVWERRIRTSRIGLLR